MRRITSSYESNAEFNLGADMRSEVYNALSDIAFKYVLRANKEGISEEIVYNKLDGAINWFLDKFYEEDFEE